MFKLAIGYDLKAEAGEKRIRWSTVASDNA
jgi:hypothetical protein